MIGVGTFSTSESARRYVNHVLDSGRLSYGPYTKKFETAIASSHDCRFGIMTNSGTSSLMIALAALKETYGWQDGDEVIIPAITFVATANIVLQLNLKPVFVDVDPIWYELDSSKIEPAITERTRCIIPVHLFGSPCDMDPICAIAKRYQLKIIEDSCETMFVRYKGKAVGSFGDIGCFSTYIAHILTTGVGGICTTNSPELAVTLRSLMNHGRDSIYIAMDDDDGKTGDELRLIVQKRFHFIRRGYSFRVTELEGALGVAEFEAHEANMKRRSYNGQYLMQALSPLKSHLQLPRIREDSGHAFMMFPIVLKNEPKDALVNYLEENGIETRDMLPLINQPCYQDLRIDASRYPVADWINKNGFYIGCHQAVAQFELEYIAKVCDDYFKGRASEKERRCLILMAKLYEADVIRLELFYDRLPIDEFDDLVLIDDSTDSTVRDFFTKRGFAVISGKPGKGEALRTALKKTDAEHIVLLGIDGADDPADITKLLIKLKTGADLVIASRFLPGGGRKTERMLSYRSIGNRFFTFLINVFFNENITDCNNLFRGFRKSAIQKLALAEKNENAMFEMTAKAITKNISIDEIPTLEDQSVMKRKKRNRFLSAVAFLRLLCIIKFFKARAS